MGKIEEDARQWTGLNMESRIRREKSEADRDTLDG